VRRHLFVDDNRAFAENLAEITRDTGDEAVVVSSGAEALERVASERFDTLVTDMRMPVMSGAQLVHRIRRADPGLPALVLTAYSGDDDLANARGEGLLAVLPKPVPVTRLLALLREARRDGLVALVEDDASLSDNLCEALRTRGYTAVTASSVMEADRLGKVAPFAGLVDLRVPGGPWGEAMRRLSLRFPGLPLVVITAFLADPLPVAAEEVFSKPFDTGRLLAVLDRLHAVREPRP
jgi:CheY-like chemotaxis protein